MGQATHLTLATATGLWRLALWAHVGAGTLGLLTGFVAVFVAKGGRLHRASGLLFVGAMIAMGVMATAIAAHERKMSTLMGGPFTAYLVFTAWTAVRPLNDERQRVAFGLMVVPFAVALFNLRLGIEALGRPAMTIEGVPGPMILFMGGVALTAGIGDWRMIRAGGIRGTRRIARHLWRMCFGLFIASGSFFLGQSRLFPKGMRSPMLLAIPAVAPLVMLLYWMWRVRVRGRIPALPATRVVAAATATL